MMKRRLVLVLTLCMWISVVFAVPCLAQDGPMVNEAETTRWLLEMSSKLDKLENVVVDYQLHNKHKGKTYDIKLMIRDLSTFRLETDGVTYIVNHGDMIFFNDTKGRRSNLRQVQETYFEGTSTFWDEQASTLRELLGEDGDQLRLMLQKNLIYPMLELRVNRSQDYTPENPSFTFTAKAALSTAGSYYSWIRDMQGLCANPKVPLQVHSNYLEVKTEFVEFWVMKETGLLHTQKIMSGQTVEASLTATNITQKDSLDASLFEIAAPQGCEVEQADEMQAGHLFMDMQGTFARNLGLLMVRQGLETFGPEKKDQAARLTAAWLDINFAIYMPVADRQKEIEQKATIFEEGMKEEIEKLKDSPERIPDEIRAMKITALKILGSYKDEMYSNIRTPILSTMKAALKSTSELQDEKWRIPFRMLNAGLNESFRQNFETDFISVLEARIRAIAKEQLAANE